MGYLGIYFDKGYESPEYWELQNIAKIKEHLNKWSWTRGLSNFKM